MALKVLAGAAPPADISGYPPGTLWMAVSADSATPYDVTVDVWSIHVPDLIAYNRAGPAHDMPVGPWIAEEQPDDWTTAPAGEQELGNVQVAFVLDDNGFYQFYAHAGDVDNHVTCQVGPIDETQIGKVYDREALDKLTPQGRQKEIRRNAAAIATQTAGIIGSQSRGGSRMRRV